MFHEIFGDADLALLASYFIMEERSGAWVKELMS